MVSVAQLGGVISVSAYLIFIEVLGVLAPCHSSGRSRCIARPGFKWTQHTTRVGTERVLGEPEIGWEALQGEGDQQR